MYIHINMCLQQQLMKKVEMNLKESKENFEKRKGKEQIM